MKQAVCLLAALVLSAFLLLWGVADVNEGYGPGVVPPSHGDSHGGGDHGDSDDHLEEDEHVELGVHGDEADDHGEADPH